MRITEYIAAVLAFRNLPTTILVIIIYVATLTSVLVTDRLVDVPKDQHGLNLTEAYADLHQVAKIPHPYNSHANDDVRSYILSRVTEIARSFSHVHVASDTSSNFTISSRYGVYFEGTNILVKIDGTDEEFQTKGGLTLSAHYDSVSTAPGTTDDGMGVVTLIQMVKYLAERRPKRTVVFNINNGEEDWLNGAHAYLEHPWSKITDTFINLEGAASGGRPILFRATSNFPVKSFSKNVRHPHGNVLSADAFARGVIRSGTDYSVYVANGMRGLDFAFYKGRSMYHTKYDAIPYTVGLERALWAMMETTMGSAEWLANASRDEGRNPNAGVGLGEMDKTPVYFDLFGVSFLSFPLSGLFIANIVLLVVGPLLLLLVLALSVILQHRRRRQLEENFTGRVAIERAWVQFKSLSWAKGILIWSKFWLALIVTIGLQIVLVIGFTHLNPYAIYSNPMLAIVSSFTLAYLTLVSTFALPLPGPFMLPERQKQTTLIQSYALTWVFVLLSTIMIDKARVGGFYWVTAWNALLWLGCIFGYIEGMFGARGSEGDLRIEAIDAEIVEDRPPPPRGPTIEDEEEHEGEEHEDTTERTPLLGRRQMAEHIKKLRDDSEEDSGAIGWWILQVLSVVPIPLILIAHIAVILLGAMPQTLADGSSAAAIYACFSFLAILLIIPLSPFAIKMHRNLTYVILAVFLITTLWSWFLTAPFDADSPFKVFFQQTVDLDKNITQTHLKGISPYLQRDIVSGLPSAQRKDVDCHSVGKNDKKSGLYSCTWESGGLALPSSGVTSQGETQWMKVRTSRDPTTNDVQLVITGVNTRNCRIYFDDQGVSAWRISGSGKDWTKVNGRNGLKEIRLWSRTWSRKFVVDLKRVKPEERLVGRVACEWAEYQSGTVGLEESKDLALAKIPAYEEVLQFLPKWAVASKTADGLVEVYKRFEI